MFMILHVFNSPFGRKAAKFAEGDVASDRTTLFVGRIPRDASEDDFQQFLEQQGVDGVAYVDQPCIFYFHVYFPSL